MSGDGWDTDVTQRCSPSTSSKRSSRCSSPLIYYLFLHATITNAGAECTAKCNSLPYYSKSRDKTEKGPGGVAIWEQSLCYPNWIPGAVSQKSAWRLGVLSQDPYCSKSQPFCTQIFCSWGLVHLILKTVAFSKLLSFASVVREDAKGLSPPSGWEVHSLVRPWVSSTNRNQTPVSISSKEERTGPNHYSRCAMCRDWACEP